MYKPQHTNFNTIHFFLHIYYICFSTHSLLYRWTSEVLYLQYSNQEYEMKTTKMGINQNWSRQNVEQLCMATSFHLQLVQLCFKHERIEANFLPCTRCSSFDKFPSVSTVQGSGVCHCSFTLAVHCEHWIAPSPSDLTPIKPALAHCNQLWLWLWEACRATSFTWKGCNWCNCMSKATGAMDHSMCAPPAAVMFYCLPTISVNEP